MNDLIKSVIHGKPHVHVGKNGVSSKVLSQINDLLKKKKVIKVKFLSYDEFESLSQAAEYLETNSKGKILDIRGKSVVLKYQLL